MYFEYILSNFGSCFFSSFLGGHTQEKKCKKLLDVELGRRHKDCVRDCKYYEKTNPIDFPQLANVVYSSQCPHELYPQGDYITSSSTAARRQQERRPRQRDTAASQEPATSSEEDEAADTGFRTW